MVACTLTHDHDSNKSFPFVTNKCVSKYIVFNDKESLYTPFRLLLVFGSSLIYCCTVRVYGGFFLSFVLTFYSLSENEITADSIHVLARALQVNQNLQRLK